MSSRAVDGSAVARMRQSYDLQLDGLDERKAAGPERDQRRAESDGECDEKLAQAGERVAEGSSLQLSFSGYDVRLGRPEAVMLGQTVSHYRVLRALGAGGMGEVYLAEDTKLGRQVALKVLAHDSAHDPDRRARFEREARAVAALNHPGIVTIHSVEEHQGVLFLTMELVDGRTLAECIPQGGLTLDQLLKIGIPLTDAIGTAHQRGITHRDLKPANVMIGHDGRVKVLDFGLAKQQSQDSFQGETALVATAHATAEGKILGTVAYMAPEQAEGKPVDPRSDIFSLGVVLYEMATGQRPFKGDSNVSLLSAVLKDTPPLVTDLRSDLPRDLGRIVKRCLAKDPEERYQTAKDLRNDLKALKEDSDSAEIAQEGSPSQRRRPASQGRPRQCPQPRCRRRGSRWIWIAAAAVVVLAAGVLAARWASPLAEAARDRDASNHDRWRREVTANDGRLAPLLRHRAYSRRTRWVVGPGAGIGIGRRHGGARSGVSLDSRYRPYRHGAARLAYAGHCRRRPGRHAGARRDRAPRGGYPDQPSRACTASPPTWTPDKSHIVYAKGTELRLARSDGSESRTLLTAPGIPFAPRVSPDGGRLRYTVRDAKTGASHSGRPGPTAPPLILCFRAGPAHRIPAAAHGPQMAAITSSRRTVTSGPVRKRVACSAGPRAIPCNSRSGRCCSPE